MPEGSPRNGPDTRDEPKHFEPTEEGWKAFREEMRRARMVGGLAPIIGTWDYHYRRPTSPTTLVEVHVGDDAIVIRLNDGRTVSVPLSWFPVLQDANAEEKSTIDFSFNHQVVHFPLLNTEILVSQVLACRGLFDEDSFLNMCASSDRLVHDIAALIWRLASERGITFREALALVREELRRWPPPENRDGAP